MTGIDQEQIARAEGFYRSTSADLVDALDRTLVDWLVATAGDRGLTLRRDDPLVIDLHQALTAELRDAYTGTDPDTDPATESMVMSSRNPLDIIRRGVAPLNERLAEAGIPAPERDDFQAQIFPTDHYELGPSAFIELGDDVHEAGLRWGAAKAHLHILRHRGD